MRNIVKKLVPKFVLSLYHQMWSFFGVVFYRWPSKKIKVIGITGTNGKTTVTHIATEVLEAAGYKVASISSLRFKIGEREWKNELKMTMPGRMRIQKFLRQVADAGCQYVVMEVTSEGIKQYRHKFIDFDVAVFTNLTPEHIESHGGFENYKKAKGELFKTAKSCVINADDPSAEYFSGLCKGKKYTYSTSDLTSDVKSTMPGKFNLANALAAVYVGISQGVDMEVVKKAIESFKGVAGRMEVVVSDPYTVIVDYAHTPDALEKVYKTVRESRILNLESRMICVLGAAGGGRDKWKRPQMGKIAAHYCDEIILTNEDPYEEDPEKIISQVESGARNEDPCSVCIGPGQTGSGDHAPKEIFRVLDRREAIKKALHDAGRGDAVIITGKGAEPWMMTNRGRIPWDDREIVRSAYLNVKG